MKLLETRTRVTLPAGPNAEERYLAAKARFLAAQQEKMEAADEFLTARAALHSEAESARSRSGRRPQAGRVPGSLGWGATRA